MGQRYLHAAQLIPVISNGICHMALHPDPIVLELMAAALNKEQDDLPRDILQTILDNAREAHNSGIPLCQDTGTLVAFVEMGKDLVIPGQSLEEIINQALCDATREAGLRCSILRDPLYNRVNTFTNGPAIIHLRQVQGDELQIRMALKGGGAENMSRLLMLNPSQTENDILNFIVDTVKSAGGRPCPPLIIGVGIGGNFETCALLAKEALLEPLNRVNPDPRYAELEDKILGAVNASGVGPQGMGGLTSTLAVKVKVAPCHIASLPVAVNLQCHAHRHVELHF